MESVYSKRIRAGKRRTYFFDVRATREMITTLPSPKAVRNSMKMVMTAQNIFIQRRFQQIY